SLDISVQSQLTHLLVGSYMATSIAVSQDRENILVIYPSEPILSEAALKIIEVTDNQTFVLDRLEYSLKNGLVEAGFRGELVARIILILGWQHMLSGDSLYTQEKSVRDFLNTLFGNYQTLKQRDNRLKSLKLKTMFLQSKLCLTHFVQLNDPPSCQVLKCLFERGAGAILGRNARGGDLLLPVKMSNNTSEEKYSFILIQVKNYSTSGQAYTEAATTRLSPSSVFEGSELANLDLPYLCFYWSLGATESNLRLQFKSWKDFEQHWGVFSLDPFRFLTEDLKTKLYALLCAYINPFDSISIWKRRPTISIEQHRANVKCFFPVEKI
ncbi:8124_t:CDS:1, partial [Paraglomus brasilianum]